jgi:hypothetical protein
MSRILIAIGALLLILGLAWPWLSKLPIGRLPGDLVIEREHFRVHIPITTMVLVSLALTLIARLFK